MDVHSILWSLSFHEFLQNATCNNNLHSDGYVYIVCNYDYLICFGESCLVILTITF